MEKRPETKYEVTIAKPAQNCDVPESAPLLAALKDLLDHPPACTRQAAVTVNGGRKMRYTFINASKDFVADCEAIASELGDLVASTGPEERAPGDCLVGKLDIL